MKMYIILTIHSSNTHHTRGIMNENVHYSNNKLMYTIVLYRFSMNENVHNALDVLVYTCTLHITLKYNFMHMWRIIMLSRENFSVHVACSGYV